ncbi:MAG TPA: hypothetical protein VKV73_26230 [Chloroflexota bacterium]|nr:hypothetical protein [Chloroflexota bacterium]
MTGAIRRAVLAAALTLSVATPTFGQPASGPTGWQPGQGATGDNTYIGVIDAPSGGSTVSLSGPLRVSGWFVDTTAEGWAGLDDLQVFLGTMDGGTSLGHGAIGLSRPDVAATWGNPFWSAAGWQAAIDPGMLPSGEDSLYVYAHTPAKGWWGLPVLVEVQQPTTSTGERLAPAPALQGALPTVGVAAPTENEVVSTRIRVFPLSGSASDPTNGARGIDWVEVWMNGEANTDNATILGVADMNSDGTWSLPFDPGAHLPLPTNLYVYAHSRVTGKKALVVRHFFLADRPIP